MKKIYFTIVLFVIGLFIATAAFNYHRPFIGNGGIDSIDDGIYDFGEVFEIEDKKDNLGFPNAEKLVSINNNDSGQIGGVSDTPGMLVVTGTDGEAGYAIDDIVSSEQSVTEDGENSDQTAGDDNTIIQPFVWDDSLIAALETPAGYRSVEIPFGRNRIGKGIGPSDNIDWERIPDIYEDEKDPWVVIEYKYDEVTPHPTPEPATIFLLGSGLIGLGVFGRKKLKRS